MKKNLVSGNALMQASAAADNTNRETLRDVEDILYDAENVVYELYGIELKVPGKGALCRINDYGPIVAAVFTELCQRRRDGDLKSLDESLDGGGSRP